MIVQPSSQFSTAASAVKWPVAPVVATTQAATSSATVTISPAARAALAAASVGADSGSVNSVEARLAEIKAKDAMSRTQEEWDYLFANDEKLAEITAKANQNPGSLTSSEIDYEQKARGFVNTMANLSPTEKAMYDKAVASGNAQAAAGIGQIAFIRTMGHTAGGADGTTYDPINTKITAENIVKYFSHSIVDPSGTAQAQFQALIAYLQNAPAS